jgi:hypothetical protein
VFLADEMADCARGQLDFGFRIRAGGQADGGSGRRAAIADRRRFRT